MACHLPCLAPSLFSPDAPAFAQNRPTAFSPIPHKRLTLQTRRTQAKRKGATSYTRFYSPQTQNRVTSPAFRCGVSGRACHETSGVFRGTPKALTGETAYIQRRHLGAVIATRLCGPTLRRPYQVPVTVEGARRPPVLVTLYFLPDAPSLS